MISAPVIFPIDDPVSSLNVHLEGSGSVGSSGFVFSPSGGVSASALFVSGSASGYSWSYDFTLMSESEVFSIASTDASGNIISPSASLTVNYELQPPVILSPGTAKSLTDDISTSGSTTNMFMTMSGDFEGDGVIIGDYALAVSGKNAGEIRRVNFVDQFYFITEPFPYPFISGNKIKIYDNLDRATYHANKLYFQSTGIVDESAEDVFYTSSDEGFEPITVYALVAEFYNIDSTNDVLHFIIDGEERVITLTHANNRTAQSIADEINTYFSKDVAFIEQPVFSDPAVWYITGQTITVLDTTGSSYFHICEGNFLFAQTMAATGTAGGGDCCICSGTGEDSGNRTIDVEIDGNIVRVTVPEDTELSPVEVAMSLNSQAGKCIASAGTSSVTLLAENQLNVNENVEFLGLNKGVTGRANLAKNNDDDGTGDNLADFNLDFQVFQNNFNLNVYAQDPFGNRTEASTLPVEYQIDPPTLGADLQSLLNDQGQIDVTQDIITLTGNFDSEGESVTVNDEEAFISSGVWTVDQALEEGDNSINVATNDVFGTPSNTVNIPVNFTDPLNTNAISGEDPGQGLRWRSITTPSFAPSDVQNVMEAIDSVFGPITGFLDTVASILKLVRSFIVDNVVSFLNVVKNAVENFVNDILEVLTDLVNGAGIFIISTIPKSGDVRDAQDFFEQIQVGFNGFVNTLITSFDDPLDTFRPQFSQNISAGGYVLAVADTGGVVDFLNAIKQIQQIVEKEVLDYALSYPQNLKISNENQRCVITWTSPDGIRPGAYEIYRAKVAGGDPQFKKVKLGVTKPGQAPFKEEADIDIVTGEPITDYGSPIGVIEDNQVLKEFRFVDGVLTDYEDSEGRIANDISQQLINSRTDDEVAQNTRNFLDAFRDSVLVNQESSNAPLTNGETYYYKVIPTYIGSDKVGQSFELVGTPSVPELEFKEEFLNEQIKTGDGTTYVLTGAIFDKNKAVFASDPSSQHLEVLVDGGRVTPANVVYNKGIVTIREEDIPRNNIKFSYWTKKPINATKAKLVGSEQGEFVFKRNDPANNTLEILVGPKESQASNLGTGTTGATTLKLAQTVTFVRDFRGEETRTLTSDEVASLIRSQTSGLKVVINRENKIVLIDNQNPQPFAGSALEIKKGNDVLGFVTGQSDRTGQIGGTPPDWFRLSVADLFPIINDMIRYIDNTAQNFLRSLESATNALTDFIDLLLEKVEALNDIAKRIQDLIKEASRILTVKGGFWLLEIPARPGGNDWLKEALDTSIGRPNADFAAGVMLVYGDGANQKAIDFIFKPLR